METQETTAKKPIFNNISAVGIIYRETNPRQLFMEMKDGGYPRKAFRWKGLCIGGNWIGEQAKSDLNPRDTFCREVEEELCLDKSIASTAEFQKLADDSVAARDYVVEKADLQITDQDRSMLTKVKSAIKGSVKPFCDYHQYVPRVVFDRADPENKAGDCNGLVSVYEVGLPEPIWGTLATLQERFGNLSNESITAIASLDEILKTRQEIAWGQDRILKEFFLRAGFPEAEDFPLIPDIVVKPLGPPMASYSEYLERYEVQKRP
ncbi:MAG: hypothetical protein HYT13_00570 [Candidatus Liptonbacteria bacterium]|nr:hypothetical protein [Candidatus Liptonbacteria bacterium]